MKRIYVSQINNYLTNTIEEDFYLKSIRTGSTKESGIPYYKLTLVDKTGKISGRIWDKNMDPVFEALENTIVNVKGDVLKDNKGETEIIIYSITPAQDYQVEDFIYSLEESLKDKYIEVLQKMAEQVSKDTYSKLLKSILEKNVDQLKEAPRSISGTGNYNGAVLVQIVSIASIAVQIMRSHSNLTYPKYNRTFYIDSDLIITGAILATIGDISIYTPFPDPQKIESSTLLTRELLSIQIIQQSMKEEDFFISSNEQYLLYNIIQTVHNKSLKPMTREAYLIRAAYEVYQTLADMDHLFEQNRGKSGAIYVPNYGGYIYSPNTRNICKGGDNGTSEINP